MDLGLSWRSSFVVRSESSAQVSGSLVRIIWCRDNSRQPCSWREQKAFRAFCVSCGAIWGLRQLDVCVCSDASEEGFCVHDSPGMPRDRREIAEVGPVSDGTRFKSSSRFVRASLVRCER